MTASFAAPSESRNGFASSRIGSSFVDVARGCSDTVLKGTLNGTRNCVVRFTVSVSDACEFTSKIRNNSELTDHGYMELNTRSWISSTSPFHPQEFPSIRFVSALYAGNATT